MSTNPDLLRRAAQEIRDLRRQNEILGAKVSVMEFFAVVLHSQPAQPVGGGMSPDVTYELEQRAKDLEEAQKDRN